jgi:vancomycin resistance protein VanJ
LARISKRSIGRVATVVAFASPASLIVTCLLLRFVGEDWWVTAVALYLPRLGFAVPIVVASALLLVAGVRRLWWTQLVAVLVLVFPLMGCVLPWPAAGRDGSALRVMSYNVHALDHNTQPIADAARRFNADVAFFQEYSSESSLMAELRAQFAFVQDTGQFLVASRYPTRTSEPPKFAFQGEPHSPRYTRNEIETPLGRVTFFSVHPLSPRLALYSVRGNIKRELKSGELFEGAPPPDVEENTGLRRAEVEKAAEAVRATKGSVVVLGDTNLPTLSAIFARNFGYLRDGFVRAGSGFGYSFPTKLPWMRIDRILASDDLDFAAFSTGCGTTSDHLCVTAELHKR